MGLAQFGSPFLSQQWPWTDSRGRFLLRRTQSGPAPLREPGRHGAAWAGQGYSRSKCSKVTISARRSAIVIGEPASNQARCCAVIQSRWEGTWDRGRYRQRRNARAWPAQAALIVLRIWLSHFGEHLCDPRYPVQRRRPRTFLGFGCHARDPCC
jgi:hypothetical protein